ncbi:hypothetical protein ACRAWD_29170 [Caulobacter segnis]
MNADPADPRTDEIAGDIVVGAMSQGLGPAPDRRQSADGRPGGPGRPPGQGLRGEVRILSRIAGED